jgi:hypothetical protein
MRSNGPTVGTAFHPEIDPDLNGSASRSWSSGQLARLPRRRRPGMIALALALVGLGILASAAIYTATNTRVPVVVMTGYVPAGAPITAKVVGTASVSISPGVQVIPASQLSQVVGEVAGTTLHPGMLLASSELTTLRPPGAGDVLVPLAFKPSMLPASGIGPGDRVLIEATPGDQGQAASSTSAPALSAPVAGVVEAVDLVADADGYDVVDVLVAKASGDAVAAQASTGQIALIVTKRAP